MKRHLVLLLALAAASAGADTLPKGLKFVEYIESSGTQWINTGWTPTNRNVRIEMTYRFVSLPAEGTRRYVFGSYLTGQNNTRIQYAIGSPGKCALGFGNDFKETTFDSYDTNTVHTVVCDGGVFWLDGETSADWDLSSSGIAANTQAHALCLFSLNAGSGGNFSATTGNAASIRLYACTIRDHGELVRDFRPALVNGTACLYDAVSGTIYNNVGSGAFAAGVVIPMEYRKATYIESDRTAFIDTEYRPNSKTRIEMKFSFLYLLEDKKTYLFGVYGGNSSGRFQFSYGPPDLGCFLGYGSKYQSDVPGIPYNTSRHVAQYVPGEGFYFDGTLVTTASVDLTTWAGTSANLFLGATNPNGGSIDTTLLAPIRIYSCKIWENGTPIHDWIPVQRKFDGKNGLYDTVTGEFLAYYGSRTDFTAFVPPPGTVIFVR